jgi:transcriptional regulator with XRE-family HTH domain
MPTPVGAALGLVASRREPLPVYAAEVTADDIKALRAALQCSTRELAEAVGVDQKTVIAWESGQLFPTKKFVDRMAALREKGPTAVPKKARGAAPSPARLLADPGFWQIVRKLIAHKKLRDEVTRLANDYPDPAEDER